MVLSTCFFTLSAQSIVLTGKQTVDKKNRKPELTCTPVKITKTMKISEVEGNCKGFWIQKGSITTNKFTNLEDAIGTLLKPGTYYVYPYLKEGKTKADVNVTIILLNGS